MCVWAHSTLLGSGPLLVYEAKCFVLINFNSLRTTQSGFYQDFDFLLGGGGGGGELLAMGSKWKLHEMGAGRGCALSRAKCKS